MNYLNKDLSKKLSDKGIVSESGMRWVTLATDVDRVMCELCFSHREFGGYKIVCIAYTIWDLIGNKENAIKLWKWGRSEEWYNKSHKILDLVHQHGENSEEVIKEIEKVL